MEGLSDYFSWHYLFAPRQIIKIGKNFLIFLYHYFSVGLLVRSLFAPWKRQTIKRGPGFSFGDFFNVLSFNLISRSIGAFVRVAVLLGWLLVEIFILLFVPCFLLAWILLPGFTFPFFLLLRKKPDPLKRLPEKELNDPQKIFGLLVETEMGKFLFVRLGIEEKEVTAFLTSIPSSSQPFSLPKEALTAANAFYALAKDWSPLKQFLARHKLKAEDVLTVRQWFKRNREVTQKRARFWELENLLALPGIGKHWAYGYTLTLDKYTEDLTVPLPYSHHLVGREKVTDQIQRIQSRAQANSVLLVGKPGVGRHTIVLEFAKRVKEGKINLSLAHKRVLSLALDQILAESKSTLVAKGLVEEILQEAAQAGNIILVIDNFDQYVSTGPGRIDLTGVLTKAVTKRVQFIGITTFKDFAKYLQPNQGLLKHFEKVEAYPPTKKEALQILQDTLALYEDRNKVFVTYPALKEIIEKVDQYVINIPFPEKAIDLLDETCVYAAGKGIKTVTPELIDEVISEKTKVPVGEIKKEEVKKLAELEKVIHRRIVNQEEAVIAIARAMRRARVGIARIQKPIGTSLFLGPTGVGKTETAKALAEAYFGSEKRMIRFDMSEYQGAEAIDRVIGSVKTNEPGLIAKAIHKNPFSLMLLDEIEKAHPDILNLFLVMIDEGYFSDAFGEKVDCRNLIIIGTSNAGTELIRQKLDQGLEYEEIEKQVIDYVQKEGIFSPEFINRFDSVVIYRPLSHEHLTAIAQLMLKDLNQRLAKKEVSVKITDELVEKVAKLGYKPALGARPMRRVIQDKIEDQIAQKILKGEVKRGQEIEIAI